MIRDVQKEDVEVYITDDIEKRILLQSYHPIFKLEVSQLEPVQSNDIQLENADASIEELKNKNKISIFTDKNICADIEQTITINVEDFGGTKYRKKNDTYIPLTKILRGYYHDNKFFSDYKYENNILNSNSEDNILFIDNETQDQYIFNNRLIKIKDIIPGVLEDNTFTPFFMNYNEYPNLTKTIDTTESEEIINVTDDFLDSETTYDNANIFITYDNFIQLKIEDANHKTLHTVRFPHLADGNVEYHCIFTTPGLYFLNVTLQNEEIITEEQFKIFVKDKDKINEIIEINNITDEEEDSESYIKNKIGNRIINPRINQPTNLKCSLNSLILDNSYIRDLLNSNRSNILFTSPTNKDYQIYKYESHNTYDDSGEIKDTWFFINADFIDEYVELHILPTYINAMDNIILISDNDIADEQTSQSETSRVIKSYVFDENDINQEYKLDNSIVFANTEFCSEPQLFDLTSYISEENYKISFECYSSYYYRSIFYINDLMIYENNHNVYLEYDNVTDIIPYDLLPKGEHTIEFSVEDNKISLGIDNYIISSNILDTMQVPTDLEVGFQQTKLSTPITEVLSIDDIDSYTYMKNLIYEEIPEDTSQVDVTTKRIKVNDTLIFPLSLKSNLSKLEIDVVKNGSGSYIIGVIDSSNTVKREFSTEYTLRNEALHYPITLLDSYDETTLLDFVTRKNQKNTHKPIQYNKSDYPGVFVKDKNIVTTTLNIEEINIKKLHNNGYIYPVDNQTNIIQTLKYFNDDLYSESYTQSTSTLLDSLSLIKNKQYYEQHWGDKEALDTEYYEVKFND